MAANKTRSLESVKLLGETDQLIFRAATGRGERALDAFRTWRASLVMDELPPTALSAMPLLLALMKRHRIDDPQLGRMRGMVRHIWVSNTLQLEHLFEALDAVAMAEQTSVLLKGAALYARDSTSATKRRSGDYDILIEPASIGTVARALATAGFSPKDQTWADFDANLVESGTGAHPHSQTGTWHGEIDLHWRPLPNIFDVALTLADCLGRGRGHTAGPKSSHPDARTPPISRVGKMRTVGEHRILCAAARGLLPDGLRR